MTQQKDTSVSILKQYLKIKKYQKSLCYYKPCYSAKKLASKQTTLLRVKILKRRIVNVVDIKRWVCSKPIDGNKRF